VAQSRQVLGALLVLQAALVLQELRQRRRQEFQQRQEQRQQALLERLQLGLARQEQLEQQEQRQRELQQLREQLGQQERQDQLVGQELVADNLLFFTSFFCKSQFRTLIERLRFCTGNEVLKKLLKVLTIRIIWVFYHVSSGNRQFRLEDFAIKRHRLLLSLIGNILGIVVVCCVVEIA
jgi:ribosomal protein L17